MANPTLTQVAGSNATQTSTTITLSKADLGLTGDTVTGEALFAAVVKKGMELLTPANYGTNIDQNISIEASYSDFVPRGTDNLQYRQNRYTILFSELDNSSGINPNNY